jgi:SAM-dependent methyltransferase
VDLAATRGSLDAVTLDDAALRIEGWATLEGRAVEAFRVDSRLGERTRFECVRGEAAPTAAWRKNVDASWRFRLELPLAPGEAARVADTLITIVPMAGDRRGGRLLAAVQPRVPLPTDDDIHAIFGSPAAGPVVRRAWPVGFEYLAYFIDRAGLEPHEEVLEVGCNLGRMAHALAYHLDPAVGRYEGFDVMEKPVRWAESALTPLFPRFRFRHVDLHNGAYNPGGADDAARFTFPYPDASADFVFLTSVFTHMRAPAVRRYLREIRRVLRPGGRCLSTWYLLNEESERLAATGCSRESFTHDVEDGRAERGDVPESLVAFSEPNVLRWLADSGLAVAGRHPGSWCGRSEFLSYQDIVVAHAV